MNRGWMCVLLVAALAGCAREEKVVHYRPFFAGLDQGGGPGGSWGVRTQAPAVYQKEAEPVVGGGEAAALEPDDLVVDLPDGKKMLIARTGQQLMYHIQNTLASGDAELFAEQVLCETTRREYVARGLDPKEAFASVKKREKDIARMFARMPMGEHSPNVLMEALGKNTFRVKLTGPATRDLNAWTGFDMVLEGGNWRLRWFV